ncbi:unnamed protein product [Tilletia controversa]|uniref:Uncharacterized protein n=3 Tax=Tilletia TaxID=13289 RepID=A0A8X7SXU0_9BASI|nr:hypothetical protein CF336_g2595 [Tilletia laevis]KAE8202100.1 hypothetical protein CF328_g2409 [Tilletia controversa]KAE8263029.1 hypothetical protein A4X03_0g1990 [Tilletia caries]KAE8206530.1 hypothetical protein CF335_g1816 [Tilletia laevis]KAE8249744.1 hypothetical protein A4X06_0g3087 [Tilletia controversa]
MSLLRNTNFARALLRTRANVAVSNNIAISARSYTTPSEEAAKGEKHNKSPEQLQKETVPSSSGSSSGSGDSKVTASPNKQPTLSEDTVHAEKHAAGKTPEQLQKETVNAQK